MHKCGSTQSCKEWEQKDERTQNHFAISIRSPFPLFFSPLCLPPLSHQTVAVCLHFHGPSQLLPTTSLLSTSVSNFCPSAGELVMPRSPTYYCLLILDLCAFSYLIVTLWKNSDPHSLSVLGVVHAYTFSWTPLSPNEQVFSNSWQYG